MNPLTLSFRNKELEKAYWDRFIERDLSMCVVYLLLGVVMYIGFTFLDIFLMSGEELHQVLFIRWATCFCIGSLSLSCILPIVRPYLQLVLSCNLFIAGVGIIAMTAITDEPVRHLYYAGLPLVLIFMPYVNLFRFSFSAPTSLSLVAIYVVTALWINPIPIHFLANNFVFVGATTLFSVWANYWNDFNSRSEFLQSYYLMEEKRQSDVLRIKAEAGNHAKSEFLAIVSHELRTPLNAIIGFSDIIRQEMFGPIGNEKYKDYITDIVSSGNHLLNIINNILDLSKAEAGKLELREDYVSLPAILQDVAHLSRQLANEKNIKTIVNIPYDDVVLYCDARHLRLLVANLFSNAVKFTDFGGEVRLSLKVSKDNEVVIQVRDTGVGIAPENIEKVLEPFVQVESSMSRYHEGTGLGLPLVKQFADLHEAQLKIDSVLSVGTTVTVTFPNQRFVECKPLSEQREDITKASNTKL